MKSYFFLFISAFLLIAGGIHAQDAEPEVAPEEKAYQDGLNKFEEQKYRDAIVAFSQAINGGINNKEIFVKRGISYYQTKQYQDAQKDKTGTA